MAAAQLQQALSAASAGRRRGEGLLHVDHPLTQPPLKTVGLVQLLHLQRPETQAGRYRSNTRSCSFPLWKTGSTGGEEGYLTELKFYSPYVSFLRSYLLRKQRGYDSPVFWNLRGEITKEPSRITFSRSYRKALRRRGKKKGKH